MSRAQTCLTPIELIVLRFLEGVCVAAIQPAVYAYIADVTPPGQRAEAYGMLGSVMNGGLLIGPLVGGIVGQDAGVEAVAVALIVAYVREPARHEKPHEQEGHVSWRRLASLPLLGAYVAFFSF